MSAGPLAAERFARHALEARFDDLTEDAIGQAKVFILDTLGVGISGSTAGGAGGLRDAAGSWGSATKRSSGGGADASPPLPRRC